MQKNPWLGRLSPKTFAKMKTHKLHSCISKQLFITKYLNETAFAHTADKRVDNYCGLTSEGSSAPCIHSLTLPTVEQGKKSEG